MSKLENRIGAFGVQQRSLSILHCRRQRRNRQSIGEDQDELTVQGSANRKTWHCRVRRRDNTVGVLWKAGEEGGDGRSTRRREVRHGIFLNGVLSRDSILEILKM